MHSGERFLLASGSYILTISTLSSGRDFARVSVSHQTRSQLRHGAVQKGLGGCCPQQANGSFRREAGMTHFRRVCTTLHCLPVMETLYDALSNWNHFMDNWSEMIWLIPIAVATCFDGKFEKSDELVKQNISRANTITMWILFAALCVFAMHARFHAISVALILVVMFSAFAIRSILFIIFDCSFIGETNY